jgi:L-ribulokinase
MFAATAAGIYPKVEEAMQAMGQDFDAAYQPDAKTAELYARRYERYRQLGSFTQGN